MNLSDMYPAVLTIVLIGIILGLGIFSLAEVRENIATEFTGTDDNTNVTATSPTNTTTLSDASKDDYTLISVDTVINSSGDAIPTSNYSSSSAGVITWSDDLVAGNAYIGTDGYVNISSTYIYDDTDSPESSMSDTITGIGDFGGWIPVIVVVLAAAIILGVVIRSFGARSARV